MNRKPNSFVGKMLVGGVLAWVLAATCVQAQTVYYWDQNGAGAGYGNVDNTGIWDSTTNAWRAGSSGGPLGTYGNASGDQVVFSDGDVVPGRADTVTLNSASTDINFNKITFTYFDYYGPVTWTLAAPSSGTAKLVLGGTTPTIEVNNWPASANIGAVIAGSSSLTANIAGTGTLTLSGVNTFTGPLSVAAGTLRVGSLNYVTAGTYTGHLTGSSLGIPTTAAEGIIALGSGANAATLYRTGTENEVTDRVIDLAGTTGGATIDNSGANRTLKFTSDFTASGSGAKTLTLYSFSGAIEVAGKIVDSAGGATTVDAGGTTASILSGLSTYTGPTIINCNGGLKVNSIANLGVPSALGAPTTVANGTIKLGSGVNTKTLIYTGSGSQTTDRVIDLSGTTGGATLDLSAASGTLKFTSDFTATGAGAKTLQLLKYGGSGTVEIDGKIVDSSGGATSLLFANYVASASLFLSAASPYTGTTVLNAGNTYINSIKNVNGGASSLGNPAPGNGTVKLGVGAFSAGLVYTGSGDTTDRVIDLASTTGGITLDQSGSDLLKFTSSFTATGAGSKTLTLQGSTAGMGEIAGAIVDNSSANKTSLTKAGTDIWTLSGTNTYTGATQVNGGILNFANTSAKSSGTVTAGAVGAVGLGVGGAGYYSETDVDNLFDGALTGFSLNATSGVAIDTTAGDFIQSTNLTSGRALTKLGNNTLILTGTNTYSGTTTVRAGRLLVNGTNNGSGAVTVTSNATLGGSGSISGSVIVNGTLSPGTSVESLATGALALNDGSTFEVELDSSAALAAGADLMVVTGNLTLDGTVTLMLADLAGSPAKFAPGTTFALINYTGTWDNGLFTFDGNVLSNTDVFTLGLTKWQILYGATTGGSNFADEYLTGNFVNLVAIPEPASGLLLSLAGLLALRRRR